MIRQPWVVGVSGASGTPYARTVLIALLDAGRPVDLIVSRAARLTLLDETGLSFRDGHWRDDLATWLDRDIRDKHVSRKKSDDRDSRDDREKSDDRQKSDDCEDREKSDDREDREKCDDREDREKSDDRERSDDLQYWAAGDLGAGPASGSYRARGMIVVPASTAAVAGIALGLSKDLLQRAADVTLKQGRQLVVVPRETPYTRSTLQHLLTLHDAGATVLPASPGFYSAPTTVQQLVDFIAAKVLDTIGVEHDLITRWTGELGGARA